jgi:hypothetical protein
MDGSSRACVTGIRLCTCIYLNQYIENSPLCKRAWVLQERFLAPRTLHFEATQLFWECRQIQAPEMYPHGFAFYKAALNCLDPQRDGSWLRTS